MEEESGRRESGRREKGERQSQASPYVFGWPFPGRKDEGRTEQERGWSLRKSTSVASFSSGRGGESSSQVVGQGDTAPRASTADRCFSVPEAVVIC